MPQPTYRNDTERGEAQLGRAVGRVRLAGASLGVEVIDTAEQFLRGRENVLTAIANASALAAFFAWCTSEQIDPFRARYAQASVFLASLSSIVPSTRKSYLTAVRGFYRLAAIEELTSVEPFRHVRYGSPKAVTPTPALTMDELQSVLRPLAVGIKEGSATLLDRRDFALIYTTARTSGRSISMRTVTWSGWRSQSPGGVLTFLQKGGGSHVLTLPPDVAEVIEAWRAGLETAMGRPVRADEPIFPAIGRRTHSLATPGSRLVPIRVSGIKNAVKGRYADVGLVGPRLGFHALRATAATLAHEAGASREEIQATGGWSTIEMVDLYIKRQRPRSALDHWTIDLNGSPTA